MATKKTRKFVSEPIGDKGILCIPGVGPAAQKKFQVDGITQPYQVLGTFMQDQNFMEWLKHYIRYKNHQAQCATAIDVYYNNFVC